MEPLNIICPLHKDTSGVSLFWKFESKGECYSLFRCHNCDLLFYNPFPHVDYESHTDRIDAVRDYVHLNSNIEGLIENLLRYIPDGSSQSLIEVGCGFGFTLDFARQMLGMEVLGYEPSLYGEVGASELKVNIKRQYLTAKDLNEHKADIIFLSEVIEHIDDPKSFLSLLKSGLTDKGILILTTPDYRKLRKDITVPSNLALLSPGAHTILYGKESLERLLREAGFKNILIESSDNSLIAICHSNSFQRKTFENKNELIRAYYRNVLVRVNKDTFTYAGIAFRLFRNYIDFGDYDDAVKLLMSYNFQNIPTLERILKIDSEGSYYGSGPAFNSILSYYMGMLNLNHLNNYENAASYFEKSYELCRKKLEYVTDASVVEFGILWLSRYHMAISLFNMNNYDKVIEITNEILVFRPCKEEVNIPIPDTEIIHRAGKLEKECREKLESK